MTEEQAFAIIRDFYTRGKPERDEPAFEDACHALIYQMGRMDIAADLGAYYYEKKLYDLAAKYYTLAAEVGIPFAWLGMGYIWYYARLGIRDDQEACRCFIRTLEILSGTRIDESAFWQVNTKIKLFCPEDLDTYINAAYKLADAYREGRGVEKNEKHYAALIRQLYAMMRHSFVAYHMPEVEIRLADITLKAAKAGVDENSVVPSDSAEDIDAFSEDRSDPVKAALDLLDDARERMAERLSNNQFFGNFSVMKQIVLKTYELREFNLPAMDLYDLYFVLQRPCKVIFQFDDVQHTIIAARDGSGMAASLDGKWFRFADELLMKGRLDGFSLPEVNKECSNFRIICDEENTVEENWR